MTWTDYEAALLDRLRSERTEVPVAMLNMLRFRDAAQYGCDQEEPPRSGRAAYKVYSDGVARAFGQVRFELELMGHQVLIGPADEWDRIFVIRYPSRRDFLAMIDHPSYRALLHHRQAALLDSRLFAMDVARGR